MKRFKDKLILVLGMGSGIGLSAAQQFAKDGAKIVGVGRDIHSLNSSLLTLEGEGHYIIDADALDEQRVKEITKYGKENGGYYGCVCCAGSLEMRPILFTEPKNLIDSFNANVVTAINVTKAASKAVGIDGLSVVWLSSVAAIRGTAGFSAYSASKGALISAARVAAIELANKNIRVNVIIAGVVETQMSGAWLKFLTPEQKTGVEKSHLLGLGKPQDVSNAIAFLVSSDSSWITGSSIVVDGGLSAN